jgi:hypothetical protein
VDEDEEGEEEIRKQFYNKFNQQNGIKKGGEYDEEEEYEYEEETQNDGVGNQEEGEEVGYVVTNKKSKSDK